MTSGDRTQEYVQFILGLLSQHPGKFTPRQLDVEVKRYATESGYGDPGIAALRTIVNEAMKTGEIDVLSKPVLGFNAGKRCYLRS